LTKYASRKRGGRFGTNGVLRPAKGGEATAAAIVTAAPTTFSPDQASVFEALVEWSKNPTPLLSFAGLAGTGKDLALTTPIPTPSGWVTMADLRVGDEVFDGSGFPCHVTAKSEVFLQNRCFEITFDTGESVVAGAAHEWLTTTYAERRQQHNRTTTARVRARVHSRTRDTYVDARMLHLQLHNKSVQLKLDQPQPQRRSTLEIFQTQHTLGSKKRNNHAIDVSCLYSNVASLPIEPYLLGIWLGDGYTSSGVIGMLPSDFDDVLHYINRPVVGARLRIPTATSTYKSPFLSLRFAALRTDLRALGLLGSKRIPSLYLRASFEQRLDLLCGLLDTDGTCSKRQGDMEIGLSDRMLATDVLELIRSLGIKVEMHVKQLSNLDSAHKDSYRMCFTADFPVFKLKRKLQLQKTSVLRKDTKRHTIISVREVSSVPTQCIQVDSSLHTYLATRAMIPTHNSSITGVLGRYLRDVHKDVAFCCYTGKASQVLRGKLRASGVRPSYCGTIHRLIYQPVKDDFGEVEWQLRPDLPYDFIVLDEASMVGRELYDDLASYGIPILAVGDHGQLPPVGSDSFSLVENPDLKLEKIHRQAADNPILALSQHVRERGFVRGFKPTDDRVRIVPSTRPWIRECFAAPDCFDIAALSYTNQTRVDNNNLVRMARGHGEQPRVGDIVICLKNTYFDSNGMIANGSRGLIMSIKDDEAPSKMLKIAFLDDENIFEGKVNMGQFGRKELFTFETLREAYPDNKFRNLEAAGLLCDFGYAMTTHKFQGSQANTVIVDGSMPSQVEDDTRRRWLYTSITRSSEHLIISGVG